MKAEVATLRHIVAFPSDPSVPKRRTSSRAQIRAHRLNNLPPPPLRARTSAPLRPAALDSPRVRSMLRAWTRSRRPHNTPSPRRPPRHRRPSPRAPTSAPPCAPCTTCTPARARTRWSASAAPWPSSSTRRLSHRPRPHLTTPRLPGPAPRPLNPAPPGQAPKTSPPPRHLPRACPIPNPVPGPAAPAPLARPERSSPSPHPIHHQPLTPRR